MWSRVLCRLTVGRPSVCLSVPSFDSRCGVRRVCCSAPRGQDASINSNNGAAALRSAAKACSVMLSRTDEAEHGLVNKKGSPYSITGRMVPELMIPVLGSQHAGDVSHKPGDRLPLLSARPAVTPEPLRGLLPILLLGEQRHNGCEQFA